MPRGFRSSRLIGLDGSTQARLHQLWRMENRAHLVQWTEGRAFLDGVQTRGEPGPYLVGARRVARALGASARPRGTLRRAIARRQTGVV